MQGYQISTYNVSIRSKRQTFKKEIRRKQLEQYFKQKRQQLIKMTQKKQLQEIYKHLIKQIDQLEYNPNNIDNIKMKIINLLNQYQNEDNNWTLVGNYMLSLYQYSMNIVNINLMKYIQCFEEYFFNYNQINCKNDLYLWAQGVYINLFVQNLNNYQKKTNENYNQEQFYYKKFIMIDQFLSNLFQNRMQFTQYSQKNIKQFQILFTYISVFLDNKQSKQFFPFKTIKTIFSRIYRFYQSLNSIVYFSNRQIKLQITRLFLQIIHEMRKKYLFDQVFDYKNNNNNQKINKTTIQQILNFSGLIFEQNIKLISQYRIQCLEKMLYLSQMFPIQSSQYFLRQKMTHQLMYLMINHQKDTCQTILKTILYILPSIYNKKLQLLITQGYHIHLVTLLQKYTTQSSKNCFSSSSSDIIFLILKTIQKLLQKIQNYNQRLLSFILNKMQQINFSLFLQKLASKRHQQRIEELIANIFDSYLTDQYEDEENSMNYSNGITQTYNNRQYQKQYQDKQYEI